MGTDQRRSTDSRTDSAPRQAVSQQRHAKQRVFVLSTTDKGGTEFQLRVARDRRLTLGYFNQEVFDRMQVIVSKKMSSF